MRTKIMSFWLLLLLVGPGWSGTALTLEQYQNQLSEWQLREKQALQALEEVEAVNGTLRELIQAVSDEIQITRELTLEMIAADSVKINAYMTALETLANDVTAFELSQMDEDPLALRKLQERHQNLRMQKMSARSEAALLLARIEKELVKINLQLKFSRK